MNADFGATIRRAKDLHIVLRKEDFRRTPPQPAKRKLSRKHLCANARSIALRSA